MIPIPRSARVPLTVKQPEACPHCGGRSLTRRGTRKKKLEIVQLWRCASCKRTFTPGPMALRNKTYPLRMILSALTDYDTGFTLEETAARLKKKTHRNVSPSTIASWLEQYMRHCSYRRLRAQGLSRFPANQTIRTIKLYHRQIYSFAYHRPKLDFLRAGDPAAGVTTAAMSRPALEVADIFRDHGAAWRRANAGHVSLDQLKVMTAIERCRTVALGGHVARCENCTHTVIAYNSCRNRHCPKCQGAAAKQWLAERQAELLPVPYFHVVFTLPAPITDIAYQNKAVIYDLLFKAAAHTMLTIAADPKHLGAKIGLTAVLHTWGSAMTHHPHLHMIVPGGGISLDGKKWLACRPGFFLPVRVLSRLFRRLFLKMLARRARRRPPRVLRRPRRTRQRRSIRRFADAAAQGRVGRLRQEAVRRTAGRARLFGALHPSGRHRQQPADLSRPDRRHLQMEGLPDRGARPATRP